MSYSKWSTSRWYSYWDACSLEHIKSDEYVSDNDRRDLESVIVWDSKSVDMSFSYKEILINQNKCLDKVSKNSKCTDEQLKQVKKIFKRFCLDVKEEYRGKNA